MACAQQISSVHGKSSTTREVRWEVEVASKGDLFKSPEQSTKSFCGEAQMALELMKFLRSYDYDHLDVYGYLKIKYWVKGEYHEAMLFQKPWEDCEKVHLGACLPLSKDITTVPSDVDVLVEGDLTDRMHTMFMSDRPIIKGKGKARRFNSEEFESGPVTFWDNGIIRVTATLVP